MLAGPSDSERRAAPQQPPRPRPHRPPRPRARAGRPERHRRLPRRRDRPRHRRRRIDRQRDRPPDRAVPPGPAAPPRPRRQPPVRGRVVARQGRADPRRHPRREPPARDLRAARARRRVPRRRAQARADPRVAPGRSRADQRARHVDARAGRGRPPLPPRAHLHRQGRRPVLDHGREQARRRARGAVDRQRVRSCRSPRCASATCSAAAAAWCPRSSARSSRAGRSRSPTPR